MTSLTGPEDLQLWLDGKRLLGKDWSRGVLHNQHTFENVLELWKYYVGDTDGVPGTNIVNAGGAVMTPRLIDTSLRNRKQMPDSMPKKESNPNKMVVTHHSLYVERRCVHDEVVANDFILNSDPAGTGTDNLKQVEARVWYQLYIDDDESPCDEGLVPEFPPGWGLEGDFTAEDMYYYRTGANNLSVVRNLPAPVVLDKAIRAVIQPFHGPLGLVMDHAALAPNIPFVGLRNQIYWFRNLPLGD